MSWKKYCSIESPERVQDMLGEEVLLTEKVDGSNFSIHVDEFGNIAFYSRSLLLHEPYGQFADAVKLAKYNIIPNILCDKVAWNKTYYFEFYGDKIQRRIPYCPGEKRLILIDVKGSDYLDYESMTIHASLLGVDAVPLFIQTPVTLTVDLINSIRQGEGVFGRSIVATEHAVPEGIVARLPQERRCPRGNRLVCKIKLDHFTSREHKSSKAKTPKVKIPSEVIEFVNSVVNSDRLSSVYSHGEFEPQYAMEDMRHLISLVPKDIEAEGDPIWEAQPRDMIVKAINRRLPTVLKDFLLERLK